MREKRQPRYQFKDDQTFLAHCGVAAGDKQVPAQAYRMLAEQADNDWCQRALLVEKLSEQRQTIIALEDTVECLTRRSIAQNGSNEHWQWFWTVIASCVWFLAGLLVGSLVTKGGL